MFLLFLISEYSYPCDMIWYNATCLSEWSFRDCKISSCVPCGSLWQIYSLSVDYVSQDLEIHPFNDFATLFAINVQFRSYIRFNLFWFSTNAEDIACVVLYFFFFFFLQRRLKKRNWSSIALNGKEVRNRIKIEKEMVKLKWKFWKMRKRRRGRSRQKYKAQWKVNIVL